MTEAYTETRFVHWVGDYSKTLHANGPASFKFLTPYPDDVTCKLCRTLLDRDPEDWA